MGDRFPNNFCEDWSWNHFPLLLTLLAPLAEHDMPCLSKQCSSSLSKQYRSSLSKQCRSRSVGFFRSQLIWIYTVCKGKVYIPDSAGLELNIQNGGGHWELKIFKLHQRLSYWIWICSVLANSVDPDHLASEEANWSGSALFVIKYVNFINILDQVSDEMGMASWFN